MHSIPFLWLTLNHTITAYFSAKLCCFFFMSKRFSRHIDKILDDILSACCLAGWDDIFFPMLGQHSRHFADMLTCVGTTCHLGGVGNVTQCRHFQLSPLQSLVFLTNIFSIWYLSFLWCHPVSLSPPREWEPVAAIPHSIIANSKQLWWVCFCFFVLHSLVFSQPAFLNFISILSMVPDSPPPTPWSKGLSVPFQLTNCM